MYRQSRVASGIAARWLDAMAAVPAARPVVLDDVADRLADLPSVLQQGVFLFEGVNSVLPQRVTRGLLRLPGFSEYTRMIESLAAVSYFDAVAADACISARRSSSATQSVSLESRA